jgi:ankyrin repeat protein
MYTLHDACESNNIEYVKNNVTKENVNVKNNSGNTPFSLACWWGHKEIVEIILKTDGFNSNSFASSNPPLSGLNEKDNTGATPFLLACCCGHKETAEIILKTDGFNSLNEKDDDGNTPFLLACYNDHKEIAEIILKTDGFNSLNEKDNDGNTPFLLACSNGHKEIVEMLLKVDGFNSLNEKDNDGNTPLLSAGWFGYKEIVKMLLKQPKIIIPEQLKYYDDCEKKKEIQSLIELYKKDPQMVRTKLILGDNLDVYRHIVFTYDGYFSIKEIENSSTRFMKIAVRLPLDLQMVLIQRLSLSTKQNITGKIFDDNIEDYITKYLINDKPLYYYQSNLKSQNLTDFIKAKLFENFYNVYYILGYSVYILAGKLKRVII